MKISNHRVEEIINFIKGIKLDQKFQKEFTKEKIKNILYINESLTHSSANSEINYENLEFLGDAVLRLIASCLLYTSPSPRDQRGSRMPSSA